MRKIKRVNFGVLFGNWFYTVKMDDFVKSGQNRRHRKKLQMQGARILRNEAYIEGRRKDEG